MTRYYISKIGNKIDEIVTQDSTGIYSTRKDKEKSLFTIVKLYPAQSINIFIGAGRLKTKRVMTTSKDFINYHRLYNKNIYSEAEAGQIQEDRRTKEEIVESFSK